MPGVFTTAYWVATVLRISGYKVHGLMFYRWSDVVQKIIN